MMAEIDVDDIIPDNQQDFAAELIAEEPEVVVQNQHDNIPRWMKKRPPATFSGDVMHFTVNLLFKDLVDKDYKHLPTNYQISDEIFMVLIQELRSGLLPEIYIDLVTKEALNKAIVNLRKKARVSTEETLRKKAARDDKNRLKRVSDDRKSQEANAKKLENEALLLTNNALINDVRELINHVQMFTATIASKEVYHNDDIDEVQSLFEIYRRECPKLKALAHISKEYAIEASFYDSAIKSMMELLKSENLDWVHTFLGSLLVDENVVAYINPGRDFDSQKGTKPGTKRKHNDADWGEVRGGK